MSYRTADGRAESGAHGAAAARQLVKKWLRQLRPTSRLKWARSVSPRGLGTPFNE